MGNVRRIYVEKKEPYAVKAKELHDELKNSVTIPSPTLEKPIPAMY